MRVRWRILAVSLAIGCVAIGTARLFAPTSGRVYAMSCGIGTGGVTLEEDKTYSTSLGEKRLAELETYLVGVVAAEMPAAYPDEALKAQAVASRTYALRTLEADEDISLESIGQAYISETEMKKRWGKSYDKWHSKVSNAVKSTSGIIAVYRDEPILAAFCASGDGKTEDCVNVWGSKLPYLVSVDSHWDSTADDFESSVSFTTAELKNILGGLPEVQARTQAGYVKTVVAGGKEMSGSEVREKLGLKSAAFEIVPISDGCKIVTKGYGHGVGMSQIGAGKMAEEGEDFKEILEHYYTGVEIVRVKL